MGEILREGEAGGQEERRGDFPIWMAGTYLGSGGETMGLS